MKNFNFHCKPKKNFYEGLEFFRIHLLEKKLLEVYSRIHFMDELL